MALPRTSNGTVINREEIDENLLSISVEVDRKLPRFSPGQFAHVSHEEYKPDARWPSSRAFSVANYTNGQKLDFLISRQGTFTSYFIDNVKIGSRIAIRGPYGSFEIDECAKDIVLISGGSGISAFSAFFEKLSFTNTSYEFDNMTLLFGAKDVSLLSYKSLIDSLQKQYNWFTAFYFVESMETEILNIRAGIPDLNLHSAFLSQVKH